MSLDHHTAFDRLRKRGEVTPNERQGKTTSESEQANTKF